MRVLDSDTPDRARLAAERFRHSLVVDLPAEALAAACGQTARLFDWRALAGQGPIGVDNPGAARIDGPRSNHDFPDSRARLQSGAPGKLIIGPEHRRDPRLLAPKAFTLLTAQQWARGGALPLHAAAFELNGRGVLAMGRRGSGKSVLSLAALAAGGRLVSDDWVLLADDNGHPAVERLREFFMLRPGWATERLAERLPGLHLRAASGAKTSFHLSRRDDPRFPTSLRIDELWLLQRPRTGRTGPTSWQTLAPARALAHLIESGTALLFGQAFPHERRAALTTLRLLLARVNCRQVATGTDLIETPEQVFGKIPGSTGR